jgi:outer membrane protein TolC
LVDKGIYLQTDYMNLAVTITAQEITSKRNFIQYKNDLATLNFTCGIADTTTVSLADPQINQQFNFDINNSLQMSQFKIDSLRQNNAKMLVDLLYKPKLSAFADAGINAINPRNIPYNLGASVGLNFSMPIYDWHIKKLQYDKIALSRSTTGNYKAFYINQYQQQFNQLSEQIRLTAELEEEVKKQIIQQENLMELYRFEIEKGLVRFIDFLTIFNNYTATRYSLSHTRIIHMQLINQLNYLK